MIRKPFLFRSLPVGLSLFVVGCSGCSGPTETPPPSAGPGGALPVETKDRSAGAFADTDPWILKTTDPAAARGNHGIFLGNGHLGMTVGANGGADKNSVTFVAGVYDPGENLLKLPNGHEIGLPEPKPGEKYEQTMDMKRGVLTTKMGEATVTSFVSAVNPYTAIVHAEGIPLPENRSAVAGAAGGITVSRQFAAGDAGSWTTVISATPRPPIRSYPTPGTYAEWLGRQERAWAEKWKSDIIIEGDPEAQQLVHRLMFDLLQSARPDTDTSIPPESLSGSFYKGHIFWDAEVWMLPALLPQHPELAKSMLEYRFKHLPQAQAQAKKQGCRGADFPWESAASGKETAPSGFSLGRHVSAGIGWAAWQYYAATGDKKWLAERGWPLLSNIADYFATRARKNAGGKFEILKVYGPDENKGECDNNTYTNAMAQNVLRYATEAAKIIGKPANPQWKTVADNLTLPFDTANGRYLAREGDKGEKTKQADGELLLWPASLKMDRKTAEATFDFHKARPIASGPAMTDSIHALIAARLGRAEEAEKDFRDAYKPFVRGPFVLFSEKRSLDRCVFTTGAGGLLQSVLYGFGGLDLNSPAGVIDGPVALPPSWKKLTVTGIRRAGKRYTLVVTPEGRTLTPE
ncbi:MAG: hypothetical protein SFU56_01925 [Capsulimonadales bacterium]|nr:hypothetical protein [Capsulimonadales bacterium]